MKQNQSNQSIEKKLYKYFNLLKIFGYKYSKPINFNQPQNAHYVDLPNNISELKNIVDNCSLCNLSKYSKKRFFGQGDVKSKLMFVGSFAHTEIYSPFSGQTGKMLKNICANVLKVNEKDIYYTNALKCKVLDKKNINSNALNCCTSYLNKEIQIVKPTILVTLGIDSFKYLTKQNETNFEKYKGGIININGTNIMPTHSLSFLLRNPSYKEETLSHMLKIKSILQKD